MVAQDITTGTTPTTFSPDDPATRGQLATFFYRYKGSPPVTVDLAAPECIATELAEAEARWAASGIVSYVMSYERFFFFGSIVIRVTVRDGGVVDTVSLGDFDPGGPGRTVESLFEDLRRAVQDPPAFLTVSYHPVLGYPMSYFIDFDERILDEELAITVDSLVPTG